MINYSIYPNELVFSEWDDFDPQFEEIETQDGIIIKVERIDEQQVKVNQIISSNPQAYLRNDIFPGVVLKTDLQI